MRRVSMLLAVLPLCSPAVVASQLPEPVGIDPTLGELRSAAVRSASPGRYDVELTRAALDSKIISEGGLGRQLVDLEVRDDGGVERYTAVWFPVVGSVHRLIQESPTAWQTFLSAMAGKDGRYLDIEVGYYGGVKKYSALFLEDGDDYAYSVHTTDSEQQLQQRLEANLRAGYALVDLEAYTEPGGTTRFAGLWVNDPNQPRTALYYGLESADLSDLLSPLAGRVVDVERYLSSDHGAIRYALVVAASGAGEWRVSRWRSEQQLADLHATTADGDTHLVDLDVFSNGGSLQFNAVWGNQVKALNEVAPIRNPPLVEGVSPGLAALISQLEGPDNAFGTMALEARNVRTGQSVGYNDDTPWPLESLIKIPMHIRFWQLVESCHLDPTTLVPFTIGVATGEPWFVDDRNAPGLGFGDTGQSFGLERFDEAMMKVSDNAATGLLVDHPTYGLSFDALDLNEWLASLDGIGRGFGPLVSIHDQDRTTLWQGQVRAFPAEPSYFLVPPWKFEPWFRGYGDWFGELEAHFDTTDFPSYSDADAESRLYSMGINTGTPNAVNNLLEGMVQGSFFTDSGVCTPAPTIDSVLANMRSSSPLGTSLPGNVQVYGKGGSNRIWSINPVNDTAIFRLGPDTLVLGVYTRDTTWTRTQIRTNFMPQLGLQLLQDLAAELTCDLGPSGFAPGTAHPGTPFEASCRVDNLGGGDALAFDVAFYASPNVSISNADHLLGTVRMGRLAGGAWRSARLVVPLPDIPPGTYYVGWIVDSAAAPWGEVGERDETEASNTGHVTTGRLVVQPLEIFADGFDSGGTTSWSNATP